jgi:drug/metabolite transporter (DMT)-like permease
MLSNPNGDESSIRTMSYQTTGAVSEDRVEEPSSKAAYWRSTWHNNKGACLILLAQLVGASMDAMARYLQQGETKFHPFQVIVARMGITFVLSSIYMWYTSVPDFPLGAKSVRGWLILRAVFGYGGLYCLYCESPTIRMSFSEALSLSLLHIS